MLFASLFATFMLLRNSTNGAGTGAELFSLSFVLLETALLLTSSVFVGIAAAAIKAQKMRWFIVSLSITLLLGLSFLGLELKEFATLVAEGNSWKQSGFLSAFFTLVGAHGLHILVGLVWGGLVLVTAVRNRTYPLVKKVELFSLFWHFLDIIWIFIFTIVYIYGAKL
jgi:cytochrome o ubiquinol oxidase subunit 3